MCLDDYGLVIKINASINKIKEKANILLKSTVFCWSLLHDKNAQVRYYWFLLILRGILRDLFYQLTIFEASIDILMNINLYRVVWLRC